MSKVRVRSVEAPRPMPWLLLAAFALALAATIGITGVAWAQDAEEPAESAAAEEPTEDDGGNDAGGIDGTWAVNTGIGSFEGTDELDPFSGTWVGFRVAEVLRNIGDAEAVGRTPDVSGELVATGSTIESAIIEVDLTGIRSDQSRRDPWIQDALDTSSFPAATFESSGPVDLGAVPVDGEPFVATVPGALTIRGVSQDVELEMQGQRVGDVVLVVGELPIDFTEFDVTMPVLGPVVSVEDTGSLEWQIFLEHQG